MSRPPESVSHATRQAAYRQRQKQAQADAMAAKGLPPLPAIASLPGNARWRAARDHASRMVKDTIGEMQDYFDERSGTWQESERGEEHQERIDALQDIADALDQVWP